MLLKKVDEYFYVFDNPKIYLIMFNPNAKLINCSTCGEITEEEIKNGQKKEL